MAGRAPSLENLPELMEHDATERSTPEPTSIPNSPGLKGRKRLLSGLKRIGSSQSLLRMHRPAHAGYRGTGAGSISCISLSSSPSPFAAGFESNAHLGNGFSTAPTSIPGTPGTDATLGDPNVRVRFFPPGTAPTSTHPSSPVPFPLLPVDNGSNVRPSLGLAAEQDYFSLPLSLSRHRNPDFDFWGNMPSELKFYILQMLKPKDIVRCSAVSKAWHDMCFDGQLWAHLNTADYYRDISEGALVKIISKAGPFARDLNLRGCVQLSAETWRDANLSEACTNLENLSLEGCTSVHRHSIHSLISSNSRLMHINVAGLTSVTNNTLRTISQTCPNLELLNVSWCTNIDARGLKKVVQRCSRLRDLRASELRGVGEHDFLLELFTRNSLERLILSNCDSLVDEGLQTLIEGCDGEIDWLTGRRVVPPRLLKHLDVSRSKNITDESVRLLAGNMPNLEGLRISKCPTLTDHSIAHILPTFGRLTHLDVEELDAITNASLQELAKSPCAIYLKHLSISYCESLGDVGMLPVIKSCINLRNLEMDNTRVSNLVLIEAASMVRARSLPMRTASMDAATDAAGGPFSRLGPPRPRVGLRMVVYDCQNVTWTGIQEVLSRNAEIRRPVAKTFFSTPSIFPHTTTSSSAPTPPFEDSAPHIFAPWLPSSPEHIAFPTLSIPQEQEAPCHPHQIIALKVFYGYQPTVAEHTRRVLRGDLAAASRLERKWAEYMMASEEAGAPGGFGIGGFGANAFGGLPGMANRRRRRRAREAMMLHADEEEGALDGLARRRRARSGGGCVVM